MTLEHVEAVATKRAVVVPRSSSTHDHEFGAPLPAWFQLSDLGKPIRVQCADEVGGGTGAGGGAGSGPVTLRHRQPAGRFGARHDDAVARARPAAAAAAGASSPRPARCCPISPSSPARPACRRSSATPGPRDDLPEGAIVHVDGDTGQVTIQGKESTS